MKCGVILRFLVCGVLAATASAALAKEPADQSAKPGVAETPWPADVPGYTPPAPGEHPRLLFRKSDLPALRKKALTPEGQAIVKRLRVLLDGGDGESFPTVFNQSAAAYAGNKAGSEKDAGSKEGDKDKKSKGKNEDLPVGAYTMGHAAGYGLLYQLTGEQKYADLGRQCFEKAFEGVRDRDDRYSWKEPGGALRAGPSLGIYALGYDLCYDGWDPAFRKKVAEAIMNYNEGKFMSLEELAQGKRHIPGSNHWGPQIGGGALALLAIRGDDGADDKKIDKLLEINAKCVVRQLTEGFGDHGFFVEGDGPGTITSDTAFTLGLQAWKVAGGKDFITPRPNAQWLTLKWVMMTLPGEKPAFPLRGVYGHNVWSRTGMSGSGTFSQGFGAVDPKYHPAMLWLYENTFAEADRKAGAPFDTINVYPHRAVASLVNWPTDAKPADPAEVLPHAVEDKLRGFYMFRDRWQDKDDIVITALFKPAKGLYGVPAGEIMVWGRGKRTKFPVKVSGATTFEPTKHGGVISTSLGSFGVDFSRASGADALLVLAGPVRGGSQTVQAGKNTFTVMTIQEGKAPEIKVDGDDLVIGDQRVSYDGKKVVFAK